MKLQIWLSLILCCILLCPTACAHTVDIETRNALNIALEGVKE